MKPAARFILLFVVISQLGFLGFVYWAESKRQDEFQAVLSTLRDASDMQNGAYSAQQAIHQGELKLFVVVPEGATLRPPRNEGIFTMHDVIIVDDGIQPGKQFYETFNSAVRNAAANPDGVDWQIYLAVKAAKVRGEWMKSDQVKIEEDPRETKASPPRTFRRMTAEEAFGPRVQEKKN